MGKKQSFTSLVKEEISSIDFIDEHLRAVLSAFIRISSSLKLTSEGEALVIRTENPKIAKFIYESIVKVYGLNPKLSYVKSMNIKNRTSYNIVIENEAEDLISDLEIDFLEGKIAKSIVNNDEMIASYLAGGFLASGSVNSPETSNYHLEIALSDPSYAKWFSKLFQKYHGGQFTPKIIKRRNQNVIYLKRSDQISDFLILIGATNAALTFEDYRIEREFSGIGNRLANLDAANYTKVSSAAAQQIEDIKIIDKFIGINKIQNLKQRELMRLRLQNEDASLKELADLLSEKINSQVSKSNIAHLFKAIHEMADRYREAYHD